MLRLVTCILAHQAFENILVGRVREDIYENKHIKKTTYLDWNLKINICSV